MSKTTVTSADAALYKSDFPLWLERQVELLRAEPELLPEECPFTLDETLDRDWLPQKVYDLAAARLMATGFAALS